MKRTYILTNTSSSEVFSGEYDFTDEHVGYLQDVFEKGKENNPKLAGIKIESSKYIIKRFDKEDMKMNISYAGYSYIIPIESLLYKECPVCTVLPVNELNLFQVNKGILDDKSYKIIYTESEIVVNTRHPFDGICVIEFPEIYGAKIYINKDSWEMIDNKYNIRFSTERLNINTIYSSDILFKENDQYVKSYGIIDNINYTLIQESATTLVLTSTCSFEGMIIVRGDIHACPC